MRLRSRERGNHRDDFQNISDEEGDDVEGGYIAAYKTGSVSGWD